MMARALIAAVLLLAGAAAAAQERDRLTLQTNEADIAGLQDRGTLAVNDPLAVFLADRLREARRSSGNRSIAAADIADDELDAGILDRVSNAGDRFSRMLKTLGGHRPSA